MSGGLLLAAGLDGGNSLIFIPIGNENATNPSSPVGSSHQTFGVCLFLVEGTASKDLMQLCVLRATSDATVSHRSGISGKHRHHFPNKILDKFYFHAIIYLVLFEPPV